MEPATAAIIVESAKILLSGYFNLMKNSGKTEDEINQLYVDSKMEFDNNRPENLPDPEENFQDIEERRHENEDA